MSYLFIQLLLSHSVGNVVFNWMLVVDFSPLWWRFYVLIWKLKCCFDFSFVSLFSGQTHNSRSYLWEWFSFSFSQRRLLSTVSSWASSSRPVLANPVPIRRLRLPFYNYCCVYYAILGETWNSRFLSSLFMLPCIDETFVAEGRWHFQSCSSLVVSRGYFLG